MKSNKKSIKMKPKFSAYGTPERIDCPQCGSPAYYGDGGIKCTNKNCKYYGG